MNKRPKGPFDKNSPWTGKLREWHRSLKERLGDRAALRRSASLVEIVFLPVYHELYGDLLRSVAEHKNEFTLEAHAGYLRERLPLIAGLCAHITAPDEDSPADSGDEQEKQWEGASLARHMAVERAPGAGPRVSDLRFRRLLAWDQHEDLHPQLRRVISLIEGRPDVVKLASDLFFWGDAMKKQWAYDYYATAPRDTE